MASEKKQIRQAAKVLHRLQRKQAKSVRRIGSLRGKLEKRSRQMQTLEVKMAKLDQRVHGLRNPDGQPVAQYAKGLRPARLIINPNSGSFAQQVESPEKLVAMLRAHGIQAKVHLKTSGKEMRQWVREAVDHNEALVIVVGGDGTIEDVALPLVGSQTALGIIPAGTMNNLARELGIPLDIEQACALLGAGITRQIDVGCIRATDKARRTYFLETAGLGLAIALPAGQNIKKGRWGKLPAAFRKMFDLSAEPIQIELDNGEKIETKVKLVTISNAPLYAINNLIAPDAKMDDGLLDLAVYDGLSNLELAKYFLSIANGQRVSNPNVRFYRTRRVHILSHEEMPNTSDNDEHPDQEELDFEVIPRAISVIVGQGSGLNWPVDAVHSVPPLAGARRPHRRAIRPPSRPNLPTARNKGFLKPHRSSQSRPWPAPNNQEPKILRATSKSAQAVHGRPLDVNMNGRSL
jgi:diacylglycerol kinase (ATP)